MDKNKQAALDSALKQIEAFERGERKTRAISVVVSGTQEFAPDDLQEELSAIIGGQVKIEWRQVKSAKRTNNTGDITDAPRREFIDYGAARYYEDAAKRGARTGD